MGSSPGEPERPTALPAVTRELATRLGLIVITDTSLATRPLLDVVRATLAGGAPAVQLRDKRGSAREMLALARSLHSLCREHDALFFVNDRLDVALAAGADGAHLGPDDLPIHAARRVVPQGFLLGWSTDDPKEARQAEAAGADYVGCGAVWTTRSKADAGTAIGPEGLARVAGAVSIPVVGIGGITLDRLPELTGTGAAGVAVIADLMTADDPEHRTRAYLRALQ